MRIAIVGAFERELRPLIKGWPSRKLQYGGREFTFYQGEHAVVVCGGVGAERARAAAQAAIAEFSPELLISAGFAGALVAELHTGDTIFPAMIIDTKDGSRHPTAIERAPLGSTPHARTLLASCPEIASVGQKQRLRNSYGAHAVDMESAEVSRAAEAHNISFVAVKAISDEFDFELPLAVSAFIREGRFQTARFLLHTAMRPRLWARVLQLARNSEIAARNLCAWLRPSVLTHTIASGTTASGR
ncbi:MAG: hypothetical protein JOZ14_04320 [Acidobacteria bacterium]|nr:hypothetical protein [Acidobacteriota bacterium]